MAPLKWNSATGRLERQYGCDPFSKAVYAYARGRGANRGGNMVNQVVDHLKKTGLQVMNQEVTPGNVVKVIKKAVDKAVQAGTRLVGKIKRGGGPFYVGRMIQRGGGRRRRRRAKGACTGRRPRRV